MNNAVLYIRGKGGSATESEHYRTLFPDSDVIGLDYKTFTPWETGKEIYRAVIKLKAEYDCIILIVNSIGAYFSMNADMMTWANVTEDDLKRQDFIPTDFGEDLSWEYLCYVRDYPIQWECPTAILYGSHDNLTSCDTITKTINSAVPDYVIC